jgi:hypothetical protein
MKALLLTTALLLLPFVLFSQSLTVRGIVCSNSDQAFIPGVNIQEKGTTNRTITDAVGRFSLKTRSAKPILVFSFIGYVAEEVALSSNQDSLVVFLKEDVKVLSEVVVTGYITQRKKDLTGSVATVSGKTAKAKIRGVSSVAHSPGASDKALIPGPTVGAGLLTAGEINDFSKWNLWPDIAQNDLSQWQQRWQIRPLERYTAQLVTQEGFPVTGAVVILKDSKGASIWQGQSDNTGKCELWKGLFEETEKNEVAALEAVVNGKTHRVDNPGAFHHGVNVIRVNAPCAAPTVVDIAFVVDATGSMGDEIQYLQAELKDVITKVKDTLSSATINLGSVFYRDHGDAYVTRKSDLSPDIQQTLDFIRDQRADGGGDFPEAVDQALEVAIEELNWTKHAKARLLFLILDAPPHEDPQVIASIQQIITSAGAKGIRIIPITASGIDKSTEYLMRAMALATNGTYVFLTDDSGVGDPHLKPTTDKYDVELLNNLLVKLIAKYAYTADCQAQKASVVSKADTVFGQYHQLTDTLTATTSPSIVGNLHTWKCFPNPTPDVLHVEMEGEVKELFVADVTGEIILRTIPTRNKASIQLGNYPSGIYFLRFFTGSKWETGKFILSRS